MRTMTPLNSGEQFRTNLLLYEVAVVSIDNVVYTIKTDMTACLIRILLVIVLL